MVVVQITKSLIKNQKSKIIFTVHSDLFALVLRLGIILRVMIDTLTRQTQSQVCTSLVPLTSLYSLCNPVQSVKAACPVFSTRLDRCSSFPQIWTPLQQLSCTLCTQACLLGLTRFSLDRFEKVQGLHESWMCNSARKF